MASQPESDDGCGGCLALFFVVFVIGLVVIAVMWFVSFVGHALDLTPTYIEMDEHSYTWIKQRYEGVPGGYVLTSLALRRRAAVRRADRRGRPAPAASARGAPHGAPTRRARRRHRRRP